MTWFRTIILAGVSLAGTAAAFQAFGQQDDAGGNAAPADGASEASAEEQEVAKKRLRFMMDAFGKYEVAVPGDDGSMAAAELHPQPVLRWSNPLSKIRDGVLVVYTRGGRPDVVAEFQMHGSRFMVHEFSPVAHEGLHMDRGGRAVWRPEEGWFRFQTLGGERPPAGKPAQRLSQMRRIAERFTVVDAFGFDDAQIQDYTLRLLTQPVYRYQDHGDVIDGALFVFAQGTNPEACLLVEAHRTDEGSAWRYGFLPTTIYKLEARLDGEDGELVWSKPRYKIFGSPDGPYHVGPYRSDDDDIPLDELLPDPQ